MIFAELNMKGYQHLLVNAGFVEMFCNKESHGNVLLADRAHLTELKLIQPASCRIGTSPVPVIRSGGALIAVAKTLLESLMVFIVFVLSLVKRQDVLFLSSYPSVKPLIELLSRIHPFKVFVVHHGELAGLNPSINKRHTKFVRFYFSLRKSKRLTDIFLSKGVGENALKLIGRAPPSSLSILHPFPSNSRSTPHRSIEHSDPSKMTIGYFGELTSDNFARVQMLIDALCFRIERSGRQDFDFLIVAANPTKLNYKNLINVNLVDTSGGLSHKEYAANIENMNIAIFPYQENQYELSASGIASDCFIHGIHFLAARSTFFSDWLDVHRKSGTLFNSYEELLSTISDPAFTLKGVGLD